MRPSSTAWRMTAGYETTCAHDAGRAGTPMPRRAAPTNSSERYGHASFALRSAAPAVWLCFDCRRRAIISQRCLPFARQQAGRQDSVCAGTSGKHSGKSRNAITVLAVARNMMTCLLNERRNSILQASLVQATPLIPDSRIRLSKAVFTGFGAREVSADGPCRAWQPCPPAEISVPRLALPSRRGRKGAGGGWPSLPIAEPTTPLTPSSTEEGKSPMSAKNNAAMILPHGAIPPCCFSAEKSRARFFAPLRCAQNDSLADGCTNVSLRAATRPSNAKDLRHDVLVIPAATDRLTAEGVATPLFQSSIGNRE
jgi:hypothetical protein